MGASKRRPRPKSPFSGILISLMDEKEMTVKRASEIAGVGQSTVMSWRSGALPEDFMAVQRLAHALGVSLSFLLTGKDEARAFGTPSIAEVFSDGGALFDGYAKITIQRLIPRDPKKDGGSKND